MLCGFGRMLLWGYAHKETEAEAAGKGRRARAGSHLKKEHGVLRRLAFRKSTTIAEIIRQLIKEA